MTVSSTLNKQIYTGNGTTKIFDYTFDTLAEGDLKLYLTNITTGSETEITTNYDVSPTGDEFPTSSGTVTYPVVGDPITSNYKFTILRTMDGLQLTVYDNNTSLKPKVIEKSFDRITMIAQQQQEEIDRTLQFAITVPNSFSRELPAPVAGKALKINDTATAFEYTIDPAIAQSAAAASAAVASAAATAAAALSLQDYTGVMRVSDIITKGPWVDVRSFGAIGDGITDDTAAIQAANDYGVSVIYFPQGTYLIDQLLINNKTSYLGSGMGKTIFKARIVTDELIKSSETRIYYSKLSDLTIECDNKSDTGLDISSFTFCEIKNLEILRPIKHGVFGTSSTAVSYDTPCYSNNITNVKVFLSTVYAADTYGFRLVNGANDNLLTNCIAQNAYYGFAIQDNVNGITGSSCTSNIMTRCNPEPTYVGFYVDGGYNSILYPRIENFHIGVQFSTGTYCRNNIIMYPGFYNIQSGGSNFSNADSSRGNFYFYMYTDFGANYVRSNTNSRAESSDGITFHDLIGTTSANLRGGQTGIKWIHEMTDTTYFLKGSYGGSYHNVFVVNNGTTPVITVSNGIKISSYTTGNRPTTLDGATLGDYSTHRGYTVFDETIGKLITWAGSSWHDGAGNSV